MDFAYYISDFLGEQLVIRGHEQVPGRYFERFDAETRAWVDDPELVRDFDRGGLHDLRAVTKVEALDVIERQSRIAV